MAHYIKFIILLVLTQNAQAVETAWSSFGTLGLTVSDSDTYGYRRNISSGNGVFEGDFDLKELSLLGGQVDVLFSDKLDFVGQVVVRDYTNADWHDYISLGFLRYTPSANWTLRAGRLAPDLFTVSEYRNISVGYTWAAPPIEVYGIIPFEHFDGADISYSHKLANGIATYKLYAGQSQSKTTLGFFNQDVGLKDMLGAVVSYDVLDWHLSARYSQSEFDMTGGPATQLANLIDQVPDLAWPNKQSIFDQLKVQGEKSYYISLSGQKELSNWLFSFELGQVKSDSQVFQTMHSGYISAAYRTNTHTVYGLVGKTQADNYHFDEENVDESAFPMLVQHVEHLMNFYSANQHSISLGWRWDLATHISSNIQLSHTDIDNWGSTLWQSRDPAMPNDSVNTLMLTLSYAL